jgi:hypothetical protein
MRANLDPDEEILTIYYENVNISSDYSTVFEQIRSTMLTTGLYEVSCHSPDNCIGGSKSIDCAPHRTFCHAVCFHRQSNPPAALRSG